jgi:7,8-dihydropterin-6-yl-methyl-4-(beta-D-ribofuranosyl)aminobenzene 5'-phosphate synthase
MKTKITVICENSVLVPFRLIGEHGLSFLIEGEHTSLFDTGQGLGIMNNLNQLGKEVDSIDRIIISHGHYDHTGGLIEILRNRSGTMPVYLNEDALLEKIALFESPQGNIERAIGIPLRREDYENEGGDFSLISRFTEIDKEIHSISSIKRPPGWKGWDARLKQKNNGFIIDDPFNDDLSLLIETDSGPVVLLGCAHAGIVEILNDLSEETGCREFHAVIGGTHLGSASEKYIEQAIEALKKYRVKIIGTSHCTGFKVACYMASVFTDEFRNASVGTVFEF